MSLVCYYHMNKRCEGLTRLSLQENQDGTVTTTKKEKGDHGADDSTNQEEKEKDQAECRRLSIAGDACFAASSVV